MNKKIVHRFFPKPFFLDLSIPYKLMKTQSNKNLEILFFKTEL
jgi:hypothetical protein